MAHVPHTVSPLSHAGQRFDTISARASANTGQKWIDSPSVQTSNNETRHEDYAPALDPSFPSFQVGPEIVGQPTSLIAPQREPLSAQSHSKAIVLIQNATSAWNTNEQIASLKCVHLPEFVTTELQGGNDLQQYSQSVHAKNATHGYPDSPSALSIQADIVEEHDLPINALEEPSNPSFHEIESNGQKPTHPGSSQLADGNEVGIRHGLSMVDRAPSRAQSEVPSRPQSRRSNCGKPLTRPIPTQDLYPQGVPEVVTQRESHSSKIKKSRSAQINPNLSVASMKAVASRQELSKLRPSSEFFEQYQRFVQHGETMMEIARNFEQQNQLVDVQKAEIEKLRDTSTSALDQVQALKKEKAGLMEKLKKFAELSSKYKQHMNEVAKAQKYLKSQASEIKKTYLKTTEEATENMKAAMETRTATEGVLKKIQDAVADAKSFQVEELQQCE
jgi:hypothetical protein